ncbi:MAG: hypothetical protein AW07_01902 [Candidatus Accumulibacter sp. SK-11]|nr:MAG: hypothetical protein AW07_01902 [Candidatus Accumulibacter sp. SK-11]
MRPCSAFVAAERAGGRWPLASLTGGCGEAARHATQRNPLACSRWRRSSRYLAICFSRTSSSVLQSMQRVAVGRASSRLMPISTPQAAQ